MVEILPVLPLVAPFAINSVNELELVVPFAPPLTVFVEASVEALM